MKFDRFKLEFTMCDDDLSNYPHTGSAKILEAAARLIKQGHTAGKLKDINGHTIGKWEMTQRVAGLELSDVGRKIIGEELYDRINRLPRL